MPHVFADISSHGFGHLAQAAPVLNALRSLRANVQLTVRCGLPRERLASRLAGDFEHIREASDFGFVMKNALDVDLPATAARYREFHAEWPTRVRREAEFLRATKPDLVFSDVAYLPLAAATAADIPSVAMCSLNWADLVGECFQGEPWLPTIHAEILSAYRGADAFLRTTPGMPMPDLDNIITIGPLAAAPELDRPKVARRLGLPLDKRWVLVALGGFDFPLPVEDWPRRDDVLWLRPEVLSASTVSFNDLLAAADTVITKPGYGTFTEAAVHGVPLLYLRRPEWPEEPHLIEWLTGNARAAEITRDQAQRGDLLPTLDALWASPAPVRPAATGVAEAAGALLRFLP